VNAILSLLTDDIELRAAITVAIFFAIWLFIIFKVLLRQCSLCAYFNNMHCMHYNNKLYKDKSMFCAHFHTKTRKEE